MSERILSAMGRLTWSDDKAGRSVGDDGRMVGEDASDLIATVARLLAIGRETEWCEFKVGNESPDAIGEYISALANSAALEGQRRAYVVWGIEDSTLSAVGTSFDPATKRAGQEELFNYLQRKLDPKIYFKFQQVPYEGCNLVVLEIEPSNHRPVRFADEEFIRVGSYKKRLRDFPDHERRLWRLFDSESFELAPARDNLNVEDLVQMLDYPAYYDLMEAALPENRSLIIETLEREAFVSHTDDRGWNITNLGALLLAKNLGDFDHLARKAPRVVVYRGTSRVETVREQEGMRGYAAGFRGLIGYVTDLLPENEAIKMAIRTSRPLYPQLALRELIANTLIHQDLRLRGTGPMVEIFDDRIEFTNPGRPLIEPDRFIDSPPQSRNERLARAMRQMGVCEERGSGWDKVTFQVEYNQLPPPLVEVMEEHTRVVLFAPRRLTAMEKRDRVRAVYQHACLRYVNREHTTNASIRARFGISDRNSAQASRLIRDAVDSGLVVPYDPTVGARAMRYVPFWAEPDRREFA